MEVDVVRQFVVGRVHRHEFEVVTFVHHYDGTGYGTVKGESLLERAGRHLDLLLFNHHPHLDHLGLSGVRLLVLRQEGRSNQLPG